MASMIWDHRTAYVEAMVGGGQWEPHAFDRMTQACRQPGSAWKPIVYAAALERGVITQGTPLRDAPVASYDDLTGVHWKPRAGRRFRGVALTADALALSLNPPAIDVLDRTGAPAVVGLARRLGITTEISQLRPMALGASCVKPVELAHAYAVLARGGHDLPLRTVVRVRRGDQVLIDDAVPEDPWLDPARRLDRLAAVGGRGPADRLAADPTRRVDAATAFLIADLMTGAVRRGTATAARSLDRPIAGKTGTTNDNSDAWFVGFTARVVAAVWIGHDAPAIKLGPRDDGAHAALPSWIRLVGAAEGRRPATPLPGPPPGVARARIDRYTGLLAAPGMGGLELWFAAGTAPTEVSGSPVGSGADFQRTAQEF
jgi:penicillin-binding protein 1A